MKLCKDCFWFDTKHGGMCREANATYVSFIDGRSHQRSCDIQRGYGELSDSCGPDGRFWLDAETEVCSICQDAILPSEDQVGDDEPMHLDCAVGRAESRSEGDR